MPCPDDASPSRRRFLKRTALGAAGAALWPGAACASPQQDERASGREGRLPEGLPPEEQLGVALVGLGNYATGQLAPALQETRRCHLSAIVTGTPRKAKAWQKKYDLSEAHTYDYETFDQLAGDDAVDIVYVVLPNGMHAEYTVRAAEAGKHVICEKPMATSVAEGERMIGACDEAGVKLSIGYRLHFQPHHRRVMEWGQEQVFGPVERMNNGFAFPIGSPEGNPAVQWRLDKEMAGGGALMDVGIYAVQAARYTTGEEPVAVTAEEFKEHPQKFDEVDETIHFELEFPGGAVGKGRTSYSDSYNRLRAEAADGWMELEPAYGYGGVDGRTHRGPMQIENVNQQARQMDAFAACIQEGRASRVPGEEGLRDMKVIEAIYDSIDAGQRVQIS
jgi:predicted dehydrogenase